MAVVLAIVGLLVIGRQGMGNEPPREQVERVPLGADTITYEARGFDHLVSVGDRPLFRIRAARSTSATDGSPRLEEVHLTWFRPQGGTYQVESRHGTFNPKTREAELTGRVALSGPDDLELHSERLLLSPKARWVTSGGGAVQFGWGGNYHGRAAQLRANLDRNLFLLEGGVLITGEAESGQPVALRANKVVYERPEHLLRAEGDAKARWGDDLLSARRISMLFDEADRDPRVLFARWNVVGEIAGADPESPRSRARFSGDRLVGEFESEGSELRKLELQGPPQGGRASIVMAEAGGLTRTLHSDTILGGFAEGRLATVETLSATELAERRSGRGSKTVERAIASGPVQARFQSGRLRQAHFDGPVRLRSEQGRAEGEEGQLDAVAEEFRLTGQPAVAHTESGSLWAPELLWRGGEDALYGSGGVRARIEEEAAPALPGGGGEEASGPVQVEAATARWDQTAREFRFRDDVRAWQEESYLLADAMHGTVDPDTLVAEGRVKSRWAPEPAEREGKAEPRPPIEVAGTRLEVDRPAGTLAYAGPATVRQAERRMECERIEGTLTEEGDIETLDCLGSVRITDAATGRRTTGDKAHYEAGSGLVRVTGAPVVLVSGDGSRVEGPRLLYDLATGRAEMESVVPGTRDAATEEIAAALLDPQQGGRSDRVPTPSDESEAATETGGEEAAPTEERDDPERPR